jgi:hypothetical protein
MILMRSIEAKEGKMKKKASAFRAQAKKRKVKIDNDRKY